MSLTSISKDIYLKGVIGNVRTAQEDSHDMAALTPNGDVFVVCDGMGGHVGGQEASRIAVESIIKYLKKEKYFNPIQALYDALQFANVQILGYADEHPELKGMGTTACILLLQGDEAYIAHVGDSRIYLYLGKEKQLHRLTEDHSWVQLQIKQGLMTEEEAKKNPNRNRILKVLGIKPELQPTFNYQNKPIFPKNGDIFLICSDGLSGMISDGTIKSVLSQNTTIEQKGDMLINLALQGEDGQPGGQDNITVELIRIDSSPWKKSEFQSLNPVNNPKYTPPKRRKRMKMLVIALITGLCIIGTGLAVYFVWKKSEKQQIEKLKENINNAEKKYQILEGRVLQKEKECDALDKQTKEDSISYNENPTIPNAKEAYEAQKRLYDNAKSELDELEKLRDEAKQRAEDLENSFVSDSTNIVNPVKKNKNESNNHRKDSEE